MMNWVWALISGNMPRKRPTLLHRERVNFVEDANGLG